MEKYAIGLDFGTLSVRALLLDINTGQETASSEYIYPHGVMESELLFGEKLSEGWSLQEPDDYEDGMKFVIKSVIEDTGISGDQVVSIGVDFTSSTVIPVTEEGVPLCRLPEFKRNPHAYVKLWKHHGAQGKAIQMNGIAEKRKEEWLPFYGGRISGEWMLPKIYETFCEAPEVYENAAFFLEAAEWIMCLLTGKICRSASALGFKAFYRNDHYPSEDYFESVHPEWKNFIAKKMTAPVLSLGEKAGNLTCEMAKELHLTEETVVGIGLPDALASVAGSGIYAPGEMMIVVGTSSCHMLLSPKEVAVEGICGVVKDGIVPGYYGYEAGQSCTGDQFAWFVKNGVPAKYQEEAQKAGLDIHELLTKKLREKDYKAGQNGLLALDWFNGVRSPLMDFRLSGMILGLTLKTRPEDIYVSLIESTAYGTRLIIEQFEKAGLSVDSIVLGGGIPKKNALLVQIYADVLQRRIRLSGSSLVSARGAAIFGIAAAPSGVTGYKDVTEIIKRLGARDSHVYEPQPEQAKIYQKLYDEYKMLCDYFGKGQNEVMKHLRKYE